MLAELHAHTWHSKGTKIFFDGISPPADMVEGAVKAGMGAIAIVDHDNMDGVKEALVAGKKKGILVIPGEEVGTENGHVVALGIQEAVPGGITAEETADLIREQGGLAIAAHPYEIMHGYGLQEHALACDVIEVFNSLNMDRFSNKRALKLARENSIPGVAASDAHFPDMIGYGAISVSDDIDSVDGIIRAIRKERIGIRCQHPKPTIIAEWIVRKLQMSYTHVLSYMDSNYRQPKRAVGKFILRLVKQSPGKIDNLFDAISYFVLGTAICYGGIRRTADML